MAKKLKKFLKKAGKAAAVAAALYGASKLGRKGNVLKTAASEDANINVNPLKKWSPGVDGTQHIPTPKRIMPDDPHKFRYPNKGGGIAKRGMGAAFKSGGRVKSMGIAKRGGGAAKR